MTTHEPPSRAQRAVKEEIVVDFTCRVNVELQLSTQESRWFGFGGLELWISPLLVPCWGQIKNDHLES